jgi:beta-D-xylosidase 4
VHVYCAPYVCSGAVADVINSHHYTNTSDATCLAVLQAGMVRGDLQFLAVPPVQLNCRSALTVLARCVDACCGVLVRQDIDCGSYLPKYLPSAVADGAVPIDLVDTALTHLFLVQYRLGLFDSAADVPFANIPTSVICNQAHTDLALNAAQQGIVLLKNDGTLPLSANTIKSIALIGPNGVCGAWVVVVDVLLHRCRAGVRRFR